MYVSCHLPGFVQNAVGLCRPPSASFAGAPFVPRRASPLDLFPGTEHCECVVLLERATDADMVEPEGATKRPADEPAAKEEPAPKRGKPAPTDE